MSLICSLRIVNATCTRVPSHFFPRRLHLTLSEQVLETVPAIKKYSGSGPDAFPRKPGAVRELTNPALEFIKSLCHVLSLDPTVADEVCHLMVKLLMMVLKDSG